MPPNEIWCWSWLVRVQAAVAVSHAITWLLLSGLFNYWQRTTGKATGCQSKNSRELRDITELDSSTDIFFLCSSLSELTTTWKYMSSWILVQICSNVIINFESVWKRSFTKIMRTLKYFRGRSMEIFQFLVSCRLEKYSAFCKVTSFRILLKTVVISRER